MVKHVARGFGGSTSSVACCNEWNGVRGNEGFMAVEGTRERRKRAAERTWVDVCSLAVAIALVTCREKQDFFLRGVGFSLIWNCCIGIFRIRFIRQHALA